MTSSTAKRGVLPIPRPEKPEKAPSRLSRKARLRPISAKARRRREREAIYTFACDIPGEVEACWLAQFSEEPCAGRMTKAHLLSKAAIRKEIWNQRDTLPIPRELFPATLRQLQDDRRCWRPACWSHHQAFDFSRKLRIPRGQLPREVEQYAEQYLVVWLLERTYGPLAERSAAALALGRSSLPRLLAAQCPSASLQRPESSLGATAVRSLGPIPEAVK